MYQSISHHCQILPLDPKKLKKIAVIGPNVKAIILSGGKHNLQLPLNAFVSSLNVPMIITIIHLNARVILNRRSLSQNCNQTSTGSLVIRVMRWVDGKFVQRGTTRILLDMTM